MSPIRGKPKMVLMVSFATVILLLLCHQARKIINTYGELFYWETFLPSKPFPLQKRPFPQDTVNLKETTNIRILCLIVTTPQHHGSRAVHVAATWARHCDQAVFLTTELDPRLPNVLLTPGAADYNSLWDKVTKGFIWAWEHHTEWDWVVKVDDDTFLLVENLRYALQGHNTAQRLATGLQLTTWDTGAVYLNGGAGYALSQGAVAALVESGLQNNECNDLHLSTAEDVNMAMCLTHLGIEFADSRDKLGRQRFHVYPPQEVIDPREATTWKHLWLKKIPTHPYKFGFSELSDEVISFHYVNPETMYLIYYLVYHLNTGAHNLQQPQVPLIPNPDHV